MCSGCIRAFAYDTGLALVNIYSQLPVVLRFFPFGRWRRDLL